MKAKSTINPVVLVDQLAGALNCEAEVDAVLASIMRLQWAANRCKCGQLVRPYGTTECDDCEISRDHMYDFGDVRL